MAKTSPDTILLKVNGGQYDERPVEEAKVATGNTVTPGMLVIYSTGEIIPNGTAADADAPPLWALEKEFVDPSSTSTPNIDVDYAAGEICRHFWSQPGDKIYAWLEAAANVAKGAALESNGAGALQAFSTGKIMAYADEAKNNAAGATAVRIKVRAA